MMWSWEECIQNFKFGKTAFHVRHAVPFHSLLIWNRPLHYFQEELMAIFRVLYSSQISQQHKCLTYTLSQSYSEFPTEFLQGTGLCTRSWKKWITVQKAPGLRAHAVSLVPSLPFLWFLQSVIHVWCASRDKPTNKKTVVWHCLVGEMPVLLWRAVSVMRKPKLKLSASLMWLKHYEEEALLTTGEM